MNALADGSAKILGSLTGAILGAATGSGAEGAIVGAAAGPLVEETGRHIFTHLLSFRERKRVDTALHSAGEHVRALSAAGYQLRIDDFWKGRENFPPPAQEIPEAVLLAAKRDPEERKATHMGRMFAHIAFDPGISASAAHWSVKTAEELSWSQFQLLAAVGRAEHLDLGDVIVGESAANWDSYALHAELRELGIANRHLIFGGTEAEATMFNLPSSSLKDFFLGSGGELLHGILRLEDIPLDELIAVAKRLQPPLDSR